MRLHHLGGRQHLVAAIDGLDHTGGELLEGDTTHVVLAHDGLTFITALADAGYHGNLTQQLHVQGLGELLAAVVTKDEVLLIGMCGRREP